MKKVLSFIMLTVMVLTLAGCQSTTGNTSVSSSAAPSESVVKEILDKFSNDGMVMYVYDKNMNNSSGISKMTVDEAVFTAVCIAKTENADKVKQDMEGVTVIPKALLEETEVKYFGKTFNLSEMSSDKVYSIERMSDGGAKSYAGEWGMAQPRYTVNSIEPVSGDKNSFTVKAVYCLYSEFDKKELDPHYNVTYTLTASDKSPYGYVITDIKSEPYNAAK